MTENFPPLPPNKSVVEVFADFLRYLMECATSYIQEREAGGVQLWDSLKDEIHFVLSHPNGWEGKEQSQMRQAVVKAGLIPDNPSGHGRVSFVTEGEASLHFAIESGILTQTKEVIWSYHNGKLYLPCASKGEGLVIVDAGGGTIDVSAYKKISTQKSKAFQEISVAECSSHLLYMSGYSRDLTCPIFIELGYFHGSVFVNFRAKDFLKGLTSRLTARTDAIDTCNPHIRVLVGVRISQRH